MLLMEVRPELVVGEFAGKTKWRPARDESKCLPNACLTMEVAA